MILHLKKTQRLAATIWLMCMLCGAQTLVAESISLVAVRDNTLYQHDPQDEATELNSNGRGDYFSTGRSLNRSQIRRGLLQFDLSEIPAGARVVPGSLQLETYVVDVPRRDPAPRPIWLVPAEESWGEGDSVANAGVSGSGSGAAAAAGDATWFHTQYDPAVHDDQTFTPGGAGYWMAQGALGGLPLDPAAQFGEPTGVVPSEIGGFTFRAVSLEDDVNQWLSGRANFGWLVLGDETLASDTESSVRGFASHEHANPAFHPTLRLEYVVPEPSTGCLAWLVVGIACTGLRRILTF